MAWSSIVMCPASATLLAKTTWLPRTQSCATWAYAMKRQSEPMMVLPPPPSVPGLIVTYSRIRFRSPMRRIVSSPRYFKSCGLLPMTAPVKIRQTSPIVVWPSMTQCGPSCVRAPIVTCSPTTAYGPTATPSPSRALGWITAEGCTPSGISTVMPARSVMATPSVAESEHQFRFTDQLAVDQGARNHLAGARPNFAQLHLKDQLVPRHHRFAELHLVDGHEIGEAPVVLRLVQQNDAAHLRHRLHDQHPGHDGAAREVSAEEVFVHRDVLQADRPRPAQLHDAVHQEKRVPMGQDLFDLGDVQLRPDDPSRGSRQRPEAPLGMLLGQLL